MLDLQACVELAVLILAHALPVAPQPVLIPGLVRAELGGQRVVLEARFDGCQTSFMGGLHLLEALLRLLLALVQLRNALLAILVEALQHGQSRHEVCGALGVEVQLEAREWRRPLRRCGSSSATCLIARSGRDSRVGLAACGLCRLLACECRCRLGRALRFGVVVLLHQRHDPLGGARGLRELEERLLQCGPLRAPKAPIVRLRLRQGGPRSTGGCLAQACEKLGAVTPTRQGKQEHECASLAQKLHCAGQEGQAP
mmetsp:Transcript_29484/g.80946  ORF Transcript_29484/g.80946 Transcript_29484/m.80946 type:complete len:256 (-) Transcript_29484:56-823(-)